MSWTCSRRSTELEVSFCAPQPLALDPIQTDLRLVCVIHTIHTTVLVTKTSRDLRCVYASAAHYHTAFEETVDNPFDPTRP